MLRVIDEAFSEEMRTLPNGMILLCRVPKGELVHPQAGVRRDIVIDAGSCLLSVRVAEHGDLHPMLDTCATAAAITAAATRVLCILWATQARTQRS